MLEYPLDGEFGDHRPGELTEDIGELPLSFRHRGSRFGMVA